MPNNMFRRLPVERATGETHGGRHRLRVVYRTRDLIVLGLGVMVGSGIFKISGQLAAQTAGPAVIVSFVVAGIVCLLAALSYAELSSVIPVAGSAYSFSYVAFGEVWAWVVGWSLILELLLAASVIARAWSLFATQTLHDFGVPIPGALAGVIGQEKGFDVLALGILVLIVAMLAVGGRMSIRTLWFMVLAKLIVIGLLIATGLKFFAPHNLTPFVPPAKAAPDDSAQTVLDALIGAVTGGSPHVFGVWGILAATPAIVFAYIGFDLIATAAEETDDAPHRIPRGMLASLCIAVVLYLGVAVAMLGMVRYSRLDPAKPALSNAFGAVGASSMGKIVDVGAVLGLTTVILVVLISLTRVLFSMSRDGLLPRSISRVGRYRVPSRATLVAGAAAVLMSQTINVLTLEHMVVIGTMFAFLFVSASVLRMRRDRPDLHRPFRVPAPRLTAVLTIVLVAWLMLSLELRTWAYFGIWMAAGMVLYLGYGRRRSQLKLLLEQPPPARISVPYPVPAPTGAPMPPAPGAAASGVAGSGAVPYSPVPSGSAPDPFAAGSVPGPVPGGAPHGMASSGPMGAGGMPSGPMSSGPMAPGSMVQGPAASGPAPSGARTPVPPPQGSASGPFEAPWYGREQHRPARETPPSYDPFEVPPHRQAHQRNYGAQGGGYYRDGEDVIGLGYGRPADPAGGAPSAPGTQRPDPAPHPFPDESPASSGPYGTGGYAMPDADPYSSGSGRHRGLGADHAGPSDEDPDLPPGAGRYRR
ncbi:amino acid permease [Actinomadura logoneensis]|uniref:Amino acid permease n=1 Tax=Actinomadura logoneensis TaxID=2293572 RepID=A0A372JFR4_9ACTN|nr:amino acid permease [Actinomadura logoneensis]RFU38865.1 amino acid permease [Actinomadura logoneensis]